MRIAVLGSGGIGGNYGAHLAKAGHGVVFIAPGAHPLAMQRRGLMVVGLAGATAPRTWLALFDTDPAMLDAGSRYLHAVGPFYGFFGLAIALYFASQGAGRVLWALMSILARLGIATIGGWLALRSTGSLSHLFLAVSAALTAFGLINAAAVAGGAWFGPIRWPVLRRPYAVELRRDAKPDQSRRWRYGEARGQDRTRDGWQ